MTESLPIPLGFGVYRVAPLQGGFIQNVGQWRVFDASGHGINTVPGSTADLMAISEIYVAGRPTSPADFTLDTILESIQSGIPEGQGLRIIGTSGEDYLRFDVDSIALIDRSAPNSVYAMVLSNPVLTGDAFDLDGRAVVVGLEAYSAAASVVSTVSRRAWGRITERGALSGLLTVGETTIEGTEESAEFEIRYGPSAGDRAQDHR